MRVAQSSSSPELEQDATDGSIPTASSNSDASPSLDSEDASRPDTGKDSYSFATEIEGSKSGLSRVQSSPEGSKESTCDICRRRLP